MLEFLFLGSKTTIKCTIYNYSYGLEKINRSPTHHEIAWVNLFDWPVSTVGQLSLTARNGITLNWTAMSGTMWHALKTKVWISDATWTIVIIIGFISETK